jgi:sugar lactone lactonase YvrE
MVERKLYRCVGPGEFEVYSQGLGSVFGLAINSLGEIFVGDQTGSLFKVDSSGKASFYATIPETFKGYHFAFSPQDELFLSIPASVGKNCIYRINEKQETVPYLETMNILGGIAFSPEGQLYWVENSREEGIVYRMSAQGEKRKVVSAGFLLGIQFTPRGDLMIKK